MDKCLIITTGRTGSDYLNECLDSMDYSIPCEKIEQKIDSDKKIVNLTPSASFEYGKTIYTGIGATVEDASGNPVSASSVLQQPSLYQPVKGIFEQTSSSSPKTFFCKLLSI